MAGDPYVHGEQYGGRRLSRCDGSARLRRVARCVPCWGAMMSPMGYGRTVPSHDYRSRTTVEANDSVFEPCRS